MTADGCKLMIYNAGFEIELYDAKTLELLHTIDLEGDTTSNLIVMPLKEVRLEPIDDDSFCAIQTVLLPTWSPIGGDSLAVMLLGLFSTAVGLVQPYISRLLIDDALLRRNLHALTLIAIAMVVITIVGFILNIASSYYYIRLSAESLFDMRLAVYRHLQQLSPRYFTQKKLGDIVSRINNDIGEVQRVCSDTLLSVLSNLLFLVGSIAIMSWLNWRLMLASIALLPVGIFALRHYQGRLTVTDRRPASTEFRPGQLSH